MAQSLLKSVRQAWKRLLNISGWEVGLLRFEAPIHLTARSSFCLRLCEAPSASAIPPQARTSPRWDSKRALCHTTASPGTDKHYHLRLAVSRR